MRWWGRRAAALVVLLIGFTGQWLPWALSPRGTFVYHFMPAVPLGCPGAGGDRQRRLASEAGSAAARQ
ncbi:MAG: hypothetical protein U0031_11755 [Thermomicrobiales bacterium]